MFLVFPTLNMKPSGECETSSCPVQYNENLLLQNHCKHGESENLLEIPCTVNLK